MVKRFAILVVSTMVAGAIAAGAVMVNTSAQDNPSPEKPILIMTPSELFSHPRLRALAVAAQHGNVKKIDALLAKGVDVNGEGKYGITPLFSAWQARNKAGFRALLERGADPNNIWTTGHTLLNLIAATSSPDFLKLALKYGANPNLVAPRVDETPLFAASEFPKGNVNVPILIKAGADLDYQSKPSMNTAMMVAAIGGNFDVVYELLKAGANYKIKDANGRDVRFWIRLSRADYKPYWRKRIIAFFQQHNFWNKVSKKSSAEKGSGKAEKGSVPFSRKRRGKRGKGVSTLFVYLLC